MMYYKHGQPVNSEDDHSTRFIVVDAQGQRYSELFDDFGEACSARIVWVLHELELEEDRIKGQVEEDGIMETDMESRREMRDRVSRRIEILKLKLQ